MHIFQAEWFCEPGYGEAGAGDPMRVRIVYHLAEGCTCMGQAATASRLEGSGGLWYL